MIKAIPQYNSSILLSIILHITHNTPTTFIFHPLVCLSDQLLLQHTIAHLLVNTAAFHPCALFTHSIKAIKQSNHQRSYHSILPTVSSSHRVWLATPVLRDLEGVDVIAHGLIPQSRVTLVEAVNLTSLQRGGGGDSTTE